MSSSFLIPITFSSLINALDPQAPPLVRNLVQSSCSHATPTLMEGWGVFSLIDNTAATLPACGAIIGCQDGTLYLFHQHSPLNDGQFPESNQSSRPTSPFRLPRSTFATPHSTSSSNSSLSPFPMTSRPRVVSGINTEQIEAPKNFVDYDDEPDKLKNMLQGRPLKERSPNTDSSDKTITRDTSPTRVASESTPFGTARQDGSKPFPSITTAFTSQTHSIPASPRIRSSLDAHRLKLQCHIIPPGSGTGKRVTGIKLVADNQLFVVLQESGNLFIFSSRDGSCLDTTHVDDAILQPPAGVKDRDAPHDMWVWCHLSVSRVGESIILLISASIDINAPLPQTLDAEDNGILERSRLAIFELRISDQPQYSEASIVKLGQWYFDGPAHVVGIHEESDHTSSLLSITSDGQFVVRELRILPRIVRPPEPPSPPNVTSLPLTNPFKAMKSRSVEHLPLNGDKREPGRIELGGEYIQGELLRGNSLLGLRTRNVEGKLLAIAWTEQELMAFDYKERIFHVLFITPATTIHDLKWIDDDIYAIIYKDRVQIHKLEVIDEGKDHSEVKVIPLLTDLTKVQSSPHCVIKIGVHDAVHFPTSSEVLVTKVKDGQRQLSYIVTGQNKSTHLDERPHVLWRATGEDQKAITRVHPSSVLPLDLDNIIWGYSDGHLRHLSLTQMCGSSEKVISTMKASEVALDGYVTALHVVQNPRTRDKFMVGGADDGSIAFWTMDYKLCARWIIFITPLTNVIQFQEDKVGPLRGCVLCISRDGTIAVIVVDGFQFLYLIPGSAAPLLRVCLGGDNLLLIYGDRRARLWDVKTKEFWRSMGLEKAEELLGQGGWIDLSIKDDNPFPDAVLKLTSSSFSGVDVASTLQLNIERFIAESTTIAKSISTSRNQTRVILLTLDRLRAILSVLLTPGINEDIDELCQQNLGIQLSQASLGFSSCGVITLFNCHRPQDPWCISGDVSAARLLCIIVVLRALSLFEEYADDANTVINFYIASLPQLVGSTCQLPNLVYLARRWFDTSNELHSAAQVIFDALIACLSDEEANIMTEQWQHHLPCLQPTPDRESESAALSLYLCGYVAAEKYSLLSASALTDISKSIVLYLHDEQSLHKILAIDLCSRGFHIWQHYIDAVEILRSLFKLGTHARKDTITAQSVGGQARLAILQIASSNTPLFMTTLELDILDPVDVEHRKSVMQIVALLSRKRPLVLQPNLPKLMEAVVKSLDPNVTAHRDAVLDTATEIMGYVVQTFPTVDFHMTTQRLAVGTSEGAIVMYDLKTAIRLYVLEGHKKKISACSFSPDGRRLVTLSLEEGAVLVWKVGSSFASFFNPGAPPRQGRGGSQPYKTINFNVGVEADMTPAGTLEWVQFEWTADRSVKLKIRESILTFST